MYLRKDFHLLINRRVIKIQKFFLLSTTRNYIACVTCSSGKARLHILPGRGGEMAFGWDGIAHTVKRNLRKFLLLPKNQSCPIFLFLFLFGGGGGGGAADPRPACLCTHMDMYIRGQSIWANNGSKYNVG